MPFYTSEQLKLTLTLLHKQLTRYLYRRKNLKHIFFLSKIRQIVLHIIELLILVVFNSVKKENTLTNQ